MALSASAAQLLRLQHGVIGRDQAMSAGVTPDQLRHLVTTGTWTRLLPSVYLAADAALTWHAWAFAAVLAAGPGALLIGATAAALRGWHPTELPIWVAIPPQRRMRVTTSAVRALRLDVRGSEQVTIDGLPTTNRLRTAVDVAHLLPLGAAQQLLDRMLLLDVVQLDALVAAVASSRRRGAAQARRLVHSAADLSASEAERLAHRVLRTAGITGWRANYDVDVNGRRLTIDIAFVRLKIAIEIKGWAFHSAPDRARADDARVRDLQLCGWLVLSYGWHDLVVRPDVVVSQIREAIALRSAAAA